MRKWIFRLIVLGVIVAIIWAGWRWMGRETGFELRTVSLANGPLVMTVTATGRLAPTTEIVVGCEVSGTVGAVYVNHNDRVTKGQLIAEIKPELYEAEYAQAQAELARAHANVKLLNIEQAEAKRRLDRIIRLRESGAGASEEVETLKAVHEATEASTAAGRAAVANAESQVRLTAYRLGRTKISSPIDGIVLDRRVDAGQTVVASLTTPNLFILAEDLARMELLGDVSEADVGHVAPGQMTSFTVNAFRDRTFAGRVRQIRNRPVSSGNVVTYTVVIDVDNAGRLLRPGMPADVEIEVVRQDNVAKIANAALRFRPPLTPDQVRTLLDGLAWPPEPAPIEVAGDPIDPSQRAVVVRPPAIKSVQGTLWQVSDQGWQPVPVWIGYTDNRETVVTGTPALSEDAVFVAELHKASGGDTSLKQAMMLANPRNRRL